MSYDRPRFQTGGDKTLLIEFGNAIAPELNQQVRCLLLAIQRAGISGLIEVVPAYSSLLVYYEPRQISLRELRGRLEALERSAEDSEIPEPIVTEVPVVYGGKYGPDLEFVAKHNGLTPEEVVRIHTGTAYRVYMLGFIPGFAYLGGMSARIAAPRLATPRIRIPGGSVGIAGNQTGIYPAESPGGWQLIGRTPIELFDLHNEPPAQLKTGNYVIFVRITPSEFTRIREAVRQRTYIVEETPMAGKGESGDI